MEHLVHIHHHPEDVADDEDNHNPHQNHGDTVVPPLPFGGLLVQTADVADGCVDEEVGDCENKDGDESHDDKVGDENVDTDVVGIVPHGGATDVVLFNGVVGSYFFSFECFISLSNTGEELVEPGDVPEDGEEDGWQDEDFT